jgi:hypothetical protein
METQLSTIYELFDSPNTSKWTKINFKLLFTLIEYILSNFDEKHEKIEQSYSNAQTKLGEIIIKIEENLEKNDSKLNENIENLNGIEFMNTLLKDPENILKKYEKYSEKVERKIDLATEYLKCFDLERNWAKTQLE